MSYLNIRYLNVLIIVGLLYAVIIVGFLYVYYKWVNRPNKQNKEVLHRRGYDYAAGALLRKEKTPRELDEQQQPQFERDDFDRGIDSAISDAVKSNLCVDDRE